MKLSKFQISRAAERQKGRKTRRFLADDEDGAEARDRREGVGEHGGN